MRWLDRLECTRWSSAVRGAPAGGGGQANVGAGRMLPCRTVKDEELKQRRANVLVVGYEVLESLPQRAVEPVSLNGAEVNIFLMNKRL